MKYKKGDRVRVVDYDMVDPNYSKVINKTGTVKFESVYVNVLLDDMPVDMEHVWLFNYDELELIE